ncbi:hypothetical protein [Methylobacterium sp. 88A]|uniref:hypothetical protein n=1 Tax=Methylobacterium sp. 88A TaxID=1131813 RepID=UPI0012F6E40C|nr:hypothetical protein [Methylobacterium sp. 88A]
MNTRRFGFLGTAGFFLLLFLYDRLAKPILDVEIQDYWKETARPSLSPHLASSVSAMIEWLGLFWSGVGSTLLVMLVFELFFAWRRHKTKWKKSAFLSLTFDGDHQTASPNNQDGVEYYYWTNIPGVEIDFEGRRHREIAGYTMVFLSLSYPMSTNYNRIRVVGGGIRCELLSDSSSGAVIKANGDMRGRTIEIRFSASPIPLD